MVTWKAFTHPSKNGLKLEVNKANNNSLNRKIMTKKEIIKQLKAIIAQEKKDKKEKKAKKLESEGGSKID